LLPARCVPAARVGEQGRAFEDLDTGNRVAEDVTLQLERRVIAAVLGLDELLDQDRDGPHDASPGREPSAQERGRSRLVAKDFSATGDQEDALPVRASRRTNDEV